jgi:hypothetical protein
MVYGKLQVVMHPAERSSLASHDRQRREMEVQLGRVAVGSLRKPCRTRMAVKRRSGEDIRMVAASSRVCDSVVEVEKEKFKVVLCVVLNICQRYRKEAEEGNGDYAISVVYMDNRTIRKEKIPQRAHNAMLNKEM